MAKAFQAPPVVAQEAKRADIERRMNSVDPVTRYRAREEVYSGYASQFGRAMAEQAEQNARAYQIEIRRCEEADRRNNPYRPLPRGAKVTPHE